jgi:putative FmdB family regulatory protein
MPLYEYKCKKCGHQFEKIQKFSDKMVKKCPECGGVVEQMISAPAVQFKGSGWYVTDYAKKPNVPAGSDGSKSDNSKKDDKSKSDSSSKESSSKDSSAKDSSARESSSSSSRESSSKDSSGKGSSRESSSKKSDKK